MAKKKNTQNKKQPPQARAVQSRMPLPRAVRLTRAGASLAAYHAALADPFSSPPTYIPLGTRPGTFVHKRLKTYVAPSTESYFSIKLWSQGANEWKVGFYGGSWSTRILHSQMISNPGHMRIVGAAVRVTDIGQQDQTGGLATLMNTHSETTFHDHSEYALYKKSVTAYFQPVYATDYIWFSGNDPAGNDGYGGFSRETAVVLNAANASSSFVEYVLIFEADEQLAEIEGSGNYLVSRKMETHDAGPATKQVAQRASRSQQQRPIDMRNHSRSKGPSHTKRVLDGVKAASETGATVMGVTEAINPGSVSGPFKRFLGLGEATEAELADAAGEAMPLLEAAAEYLPLALI